MKQIIKILSRQVKFACLILTLACSLSLAKETFYSALESKAEVEKEGGQVLGTAKFVEAKWGNGFLAAEGKDVVAFPVEDRFTKLEEGTVELFVKMGVDAKQMTGEIFFWFTYKRGTDAIFLQFDGRKGAGTTGMRIKSGGGWHDAYSKPVKWKKGELHHMAGTWGPDGIKLYLDGKLAAEDEFNGGPKQFAKTFSINNVEPEKVGNFASKCVIDEVRLSDHQKKPDELILNPKEFFPVHPMGKATTTWGYLKTQAN